jgi:hypothetical protein
MLNLARFARWTAPLYAGLPVSINVRGRKPLSFLKPAPALKPMLHADRFADNVPWSGDETTHTGINRYADNAL